MNPETCPRPVSLKQRPTIKPMKNQSTTHNLAGHVWLLIAAIIFGIMMSDSCLAGFTGPYQPDANTLHLWHLTDAGPTLAVDSTINPQTVPMTLTNTPGKNALTPESDTYFSLMNQPGPSAILYSNAIGTNYGNYTSSIMTTQYSCFYSPYTTISSDPYPLYTSIANYVNTNTGAFTFEAIIRPNVSLTQPISGYSQPNIMSGDNGGATGYGRGWLWRFLAGTPANEAEMEFNDVVHSGNNHDYTAVLPTTGNDQPILGSNDWYHVAVAYTGSAPTNGDPTNVLTFYWTHIDGGVTNAHVLANFYNAFTYTNASASGMLNWAPNKLCTGLFPTNSLFGTPTLVVGGDGRGALNGNVADGVGFDGNIEEIRISSCYRHPNEMMFDTSVEPLPAVIYAISTNIIVGYDQTLSLSPVVGGSTPITAQWYQIAGGVTNALAGQTNVTLTVSNVTYAANGQYFVLVTNALGNASSLPFGLAQVTVGAAFQELFNTGCDANNSPLDQTAPGSYDLHYSLTADPDPNGVIPNAVVWGDGPPVGINGFAANGPASVWIGPEENAGTNGGTYTFNTAFQINQTTLASNTPNNALDGTLWLSGPTGGSVAFIINGYYTNYAIPANAIATPLNFGIPLNLLQYGSNTLSFNVTNPASATIGFRLQLAGLGYALTTAPAISNQPAADTVNYGATAGFSVVSIGAPPLSYQWYSNGVAVVGANARTLSFVATNFTVSELVNDQFTANYQVVVTNFQGAVTSSVAVLTVNDQFSAVSAGLPIWNQPATTQTNVMVQFSTGVDPVTGTETGNYSLTSSGSDTPTVNSAALFGANEIELTTSPLNPANTYTLTVQGVESQSGVVMSPSPTNFTLGVYPAATVLWLRADTGVSVDNGANTVYQWNDISGNGNDLYQQDDPSIYEPLLVTNSYLKKPAIRFNGFGNGLNATYMQAAPTTTLGITNDISIFAVVEFATEAGGTNGEIVGKTGLQTANAANKPAPYDYYVGSGQVSLYRGNGSAVAAVNSTAAPTVGSPHLLDVVQSGNNVVHRLDGNPNGSGTLSTTIADLGQDLQIGERADGKNRLTGDMAELIVIGSAVSTNDLASIENYLVTRYSLPTGTNSYAYFVQTPASSTNLDVGSVMTLPALVGGTGPLWYQWSDVDAGTNIATGTTNGSTLNATLIYTNVPAAWNGDTLELSISNQYGSSSAYVSLTVIAGKPEIVIQPLSAFYTDAGGSATNSVVAYGAVPLAYQWQFNNTNLVNGSEISGAQSATLILSDVQVSQAGNYQVIVTNIDGTVTSSTATLTVLGAPPLGFDSGLGWSGNAARATTFTATMISSNVLELTDGGGSEGSTFFFDYPEYIGGFEASFTYQALPSPTPNGLADGITFCLQNSPSGVDIVGAPGGDLAVNGITPSAELELNVYASDGVGYIFETNGITPSSPQQYNPVLPVSLGSGDPIGVSISYVQGELYLSLTDAVAQTSFSTNVAASIPSIVGGSTALVGFTGADGGQSSIQTVSNFTFVSIPPETIQLNNAHSLISWPGSVQGYELQETTNLLSGTWINVTNPITEVNGTNQVSTPATAADTFYRLMLQP